MILCSWIATLATPPLPPELIELLFQIQLHNNLYHFRYYIRANQNAKGNKNIPRAIAKVGKKLRVNGENVLTMEYDRETASISVFMDDKIELLNVTYDRSSRPIRFGPKNGLFTEVELEYDRFSRLSSWKWGDLSESYGFDRAGRLFEIKYADGSSLQYAFKDMFSSLVSNIELNT